MLSSSRLQIKDQLREQDSFDQLREDIRKEGRVIRELKETHRHVYEETIDKDTVADLLKLPRHTNKVQAEPGIEPQTSRTLSGLSTSRPGENCSSTNYRNTSGDTNEYRSNYSSIGDSNGYRSPYDTSSYER